VRAAARRAGAYHASVTCQRGAEAERPVLAAQPASQLGNLVEVQQRLRSWRGRSSSSTIHVCTALAVIGTARGRNLSLQLERLDTRVRGLRTSHGRQRLCSRRLDEESAAPRAGIVRRGDGGPRATAGGRTRRRSPLISSSAADACSPSSRASGSRRRRDRGRDRSRGLGHLRGSGRSTRRDATSCPGFIDAQHAPRVAEAARRTSSRASCSRSGRRRSSPTRTSSRTCSAPTASTGCTTLCAGLPLEVYFMASSCVPALALRVAARALDGRPRGLLRRRRVLGLAR
jgi:hypothetical protein